MGDAIAQPAVRYMFYRVNARIEYLPQASDILHMATDDQPQASGLIAYGFGGGSVEHGPWFPVGARLKSELDHGCPKVGQSPDLLPAMLRRSHDQSVPVVMHWQGIASGRTEYRAGTGCCGGLPCGCLCQGADGFQRRPDIADGCDAMLQPALMSLLWRVQAVDVAVDDPGHDKGIRDSDCPWYIYGVDRDNVDDTGTVNDNGMVMKRWFVFSCENSAGQRKGSVRMCR